MKTLKVIFGMLQVLLLAASCQKDEFDLSKIKRPVWEPELAVPLFHASLTVQDLLDKGDKDAIVQVGEDKFCTVIYSSDLLRFSTDDILDIPDQYYGEQFSLTQAQIDFFILNTSLQVEYPLEFDFGLSPGVELDSMRLKSGKLLLKITSRLKHNVELTTVFNNILLDNDPFVVNCDLSYNKSLPVVCEKEYDLSSSIISLDDLLTDGKIRAGVKMKLENLGNEISPSDEVKVEILIKDLDFQSAYGYIGSQEFTGVSDTVYLQIFKNSAGLGRFSLAEPELELIVQNSFGIPMGIQFLDLKARTVNDKLYNINGPGISAPFVVKSPSISEIGQRVETRLIYNKDNSNIFNIVEQFPKNIFYDVKAVTNPQGKTKTNFLLDTSEIKMAVNVRLPLYGSASDFVLYDTIELEISDVEEVSRVGFRTRVENGFPINFKIQIYFANEQGEIIDSLFPTENFAPAAITESQSGEVVGPTTHLMDVEFDESRLPKLPETRMMILKATASTDQDAGNIRIYTDQDFKVELSASAGLKINL